MGRRKPFPKNGDRDGAVPAVAAQTAPDPQPASAPSLTCACCGEEVAPGVEPDIMVAADSAGATRLTPASFRGRVAVLDTLVDVHLIVPDGQLQEFIDAFKEQGLVCARSTERTR